MPPPSTTSNWPVIKSLSELARKNRRADDIGGGFDAFETRAYPCFLRAVAVLPPRPISSLMVEPGVMQLTLMPNSPNCRAITRVRATTPPFAVV